jgi:hypothetical protein
MRTRHVTAAVLAVALGLATAITPDDAHARSNGGGGGGGGKIGGSSHGGSFGGGARASFSGGGARFSVVAAPRASVGMSPRPAQGYVNAGQRVHHARRGHRGGGGYYGFYGDTYAYGYGTFVSGRSYSTCGWLKARYEDTGQHKWRKRYYECLNGDDD